MVANFLFDNLIEHFSDFGRKHGVFVEIAPVPHAVGDYIRVAFDSESLRFKAIGVNHQDQTVRSCCLSNLGKNLRLQDGRQIVTGHTIYVCDLQDSGGWDWSEGEPPKSNPAYYLRFCKSYARMGGTMRYLQCDNAALVHNLYRLLRQEFA